MSKRELELYIHIPFCVKKCAYCDFLSGPSDGQTKRKYADALIREIETSKNIYSGYCVKTVFVGGGTPSVLERDETARIFHAVYNNFNISDGAEITMEVNPGTVTEEKAECWKTCGINRLSIGLQSSDNDELRILGRMHTFEDFLRTWSIVRKCGFDNVNIDLISAVPGQSTESWASTLRTVAELGPEHISAYSLIIEEGTPFYELYGQNRNPEYPELPDEDTEREMYRSTQRILSEYDYFRYEISNYSRKGYECRHNLGYWERKEYLGLGLGAASLINEYRFHNTGNMKKYLDIFTGSKKERTETAAGMPGQAAENYESLGLCDRMEEFMFLGLRKTDGITDSDFLKAFGRELTEIYGPQLNKLMEQGLIERKGERIRLTEYGTDVSNYVFSEFIF